MLSPKTVHLIIKHLDCVDESLAKRMIRKRPHSEPALTSRLCDLLDEDTQAEENLPYSLEHLNRDLSQGDGLARLSCRIDTHEYLPEMEGWVTQADLGFVINYRDHLLPKESWSVAWLLQAKRLTANLHGSPLYTEASGFTAVDAKQQERIKKLRKAVGVEFIKYLLYCPRPSALDNETRAKLAHLRYKKLASGIFDYTLGLETRDDLSSDTSTLAAGIFVAGTDALPRNLTQVHNTILDGCCPLSWFFAAHFASDINPNTFHHGGLVSAPTYTQIYPGQDCPDFATRPLGKIELAHAIVRGHPVAIEQLRDSLDIPENRRIQALPPHTITIDVSIGSDFNDNTRLIQLE